MQNPRINKEIQKLSPQHVDNIPTNHRFSYEHACTHSHISTCTCKHTNTLWLPGNHPSWNNFHAITLNY